MGEWERDHAPRVEAAGGAAAAAAAAARGDGRLLLEGRCRRGLHGAGEEEAGGGQTLGERRAAAPRVGPAGGQERRHGALCTTSTSTSTSGGGGGTATATAAATTGATWAVCRAAQVLEGVVQEGGEVLEGPPGAWLVGQEGPPLGVAEEAVVEREGDGEEAEAAGLPGQVGEEACVLGRCFWEGESIVHPMLQESFCFFLCKAQTGTHRGRPPPVGTGRRRA
jgi:hypothetical protein